MWFLLFLEKFSLKTKEDIKIITVNVKVFFHNKAYIREIDMSYSSIF